MKRISKAKLKPIAELKVGELFRFSTRSGGTLAIYLREVNATRKVVGLLIETPQKSLKWIAGDFGGHCVSFGTDWAIEEIHDAETTPTGAPDTDSKTLFLGADALYLRFEPESKMEIASTEYDVEKQAIVDVMPRPVAPIGTWAIWESEEALDQINSEPLYTYVAETKDA